jgi:hypothetical protein
VATPVRLLTALLRPPGRLATNAQSRLLNFSQERGWPFGFDTPRAVNSSMITDAIN